MLSIGKRIKMARVLKGLNQKEFAQLAGTNHVYLSWIENDLRLPTSDELAAIEKALELKLDTPEANKAFNYFIPIAA